ncbi:hypothetical protein [Bauldia litoralis]|uniref:hypothetical protein n=1 Tax=Bauldia litoralis TaxID=665467 RepID=UPI0032655E3B
MRQRSALGSVIFAMAALATMPLAAAEASLICTNAGNRYQVGDYACLPGCHGRQRYARCDAVSQNASWTYVSDVCPMAMFTPETPDGVTVAPVTTAMSPIPYDITSCAIDPEIEARLPG